MYFKFTQSFDKKHLREIVEYRLQVNSEQLDTHNKAADVYKPNFSVTNYIFHSNMIMKT